MVEKLIKKELSFTKLIVKVQKVGKDLVVVIEGGDKPHIGCTVLSIPRDSLKTAGKISCTSSVINITGHKDEEICRYIAEAVCRSKHAITVCTGGFHVENMSEQQLKEVLEVIPEIILEILE